MIIMEEDDSTMTDLIGVSCLRSTFASVVRPAVLACQPEGGSWCQKNKS